MRTGRYDKGSTGPNSGKSIPPLFERARLVQLLQPEIVLAKEKFIPDWLRKPFGSQQHTGFVDADEYPWRPSWPAPSSRYALYFEVANRIACLYRLTETHPNHIGVLFRWLDQYIPMAIFMQTTNRYDYEADELLAVWPMASNVADIDSLPNITMHVLYSPQRGIDRESPFSHLADRALADILKKADCAPCRSRGYSSIIEKRLKQEYGRYLYDALARIVLVSMLGSYHHTNVQACFHARYALYEWYIFSGSDQFILLDWIARNPMLLTYCLRELIFMTCETLPSYENYMIHRQRWHSMRRNALDAMDEVRAHINENLRSRDLRVIRACRGLKFYPELPNELISPLMDFNERNLQFSPRPMTDNVTEKMRKSFVAVDKMNGDLSSPTSEELEAMTDLGTVVQTYGELSQDFPYELLHRFFGVSFDSVQRLRNGEESYVREVDRTRIRHALNYIRRDNQRDYRLLRSYFESVHKVDGLIFSDLPYSITKDQIQTLRIQYGIGPGDNLPKGAGSFLVCPNCTFFKATVIHDESRRGKEVRTPIYDASSHKIFCQRIIPRQQGSNRRETDERSKKRYEKKIKDYEPCKYSELILVNMIGRIVWSREQKASVFMCPGCAQLCTHGRHSFTNGILGCGCALEQKDNLSKKIPLSCVICDHHKKGMTWLTVADDNQEPTQIRTLPFCDKHFPRWSKRSHQIETVSKIKKMFDAFAFTIAVRDDEGKEIDRIAIRREQRGFKKL